MYKQNRKKKKKKEKEKKKKKIKRTDRKKTHSFLRSDKFLQH